MQNIGRDHTLRLWFHSNGLTVLLMVVSAITGAVADRTFRPTVLLMAAPAPALVQIPASALTEHEQTSTTSRRADDELSQKLLDLRLAQITATSRRADDELSQKLLDLRLARAGLEQTQVMSNPPDDELRQKLLDMRLTQK